MLQFREKKLKPYKPRQDSASSLAQKEIFGLQIGNFKPTRRPSRPSRRRAFPLDPVDGALAEAVDLEEDGRVDEDVHQSVSLDVNVAPTGKEPLRNVAHVEQHSH